MELLLKRIVKSVCFVFKSILKAIIAFIVSIINHHSLSDFIVNEKLFERVSKKYEKIKFFFPFISFQCFWRRLIKEITQTKENEKIAYNFLMHEMANSDICRLTASRLFYFTKLLDNNSCKAILDFANDTDNKIYRYWITQDISRFTFLLQRGFYDDYYTDRRKLLKKIAIESKFKQPNIQKSDINTSKSSKLCILALVLNKNITHSVQRVVTMYANGLSNYFDEINIITLDIFSATKSEKKYEATVLPHQLSISMKKDIERYFKKNISVTYPKGNNYVEKLQSSLDAIYEFNPSIILDITDEYSVISYIYSQTFLTVYSPLRSSVSSSFFSYMLGDKRITEELNNKFKCLDNNKILNWVGLEYVPLKTKAYDRSKYRIKKDAFVIVTVGNNAGVCTDDFVDKVVLMLTINKNFIWILVGNKAPKYFHDHYENLIKEKRVIEWGFEKDLYGFYGMCDIMLRPNTTGGSGATAIAAMKKLPIVMTNHICDATRWLGTTYSPYSTYDELMIHIVELSRNKEMYTREANFVYSLVEKVSDSQEKWIELANMLNKLQNLQKTNGA